MGWYYVLPVGKNECKRRRSFFSAKRLGLVPSNLELQLRSRPYLGVPQKLTL